MLTIMELKAREDGGHGLQSQSHRTECCLEGWVAVPEELAEKVWTAAGGGGTGAYGGGAAAGRCGFSGGCDGRGAVRRKSRELEGKKGEVL